MTPASSTASAAGTHPGSRVAAIDALRGFAGLSVMCHHFVSRGSLYGDGAEIPHVLQPFAHYGHMGVPIFFVISGFVLPLSLATGGYAFRDAPRFIAKRLIRLEPVYLVSLVATLVLWWAASHTSHFRGPPFDPTWGRIASHVAYLTALLGYPWLAPVYWTLGLEFQFYLLMALLFPLLDRGGAWSRTPLLLGLMALDRLDVPESIFASWGSLFAVGIATFYVRDRQRCHWLDVVTGLLGFGMIAADHGYAVSLAALASVAMILTDCMCPLAPLTWIGSISYSLYLFHWIIGQKIINIGGRCAQNDVQRMLWFMAGILGSLAVSWVMWRYIEHPCQRLASRIRYSGSRSSAREPRSISTSPARVTGGHD